MKCEKTSVSLSHWLERVSVATLGAILMWKGIWAGWHTLGTDFPQYYVVAKLIAEHCCLDRIYDWVWLQRAADHAGISHQLVGFSGLTPFSVFPVFPLVWLPVLEAKRAWITFNLGLLVTSIYVLRNCSGLPLLRTWLIALLAVIPLRTSFAFGQMHLVVCALLIAGWCFHLRGKQVACGCCIAIAGALKIYPLFYCFYFVIKKRWRALGTTVAISAICLMLCFEVFGQPAMSSFLCEQLPRTLQGEGNNPFLASTTSASAMFHRLFLFEPELNPHPLVSSLLLYATLYALWQALLAALTLLGMQRGMQSSDRETLEWCAFLSLLLFLSSAPATYHFVALITAAVPTYAVLWRTRPSLGAAFLVVYAVACNASNIMLPLPLPPAHASIFVTKLWAGVGLILIYAWLLIRARQDGAAKNKHRSEPPSNRAKSLSPAIAPYAIAGVTVAAIWLGGFMSAWYHMRSSSTGNSRKMMLTDQAWMRTQPQTTSSGLYYLAMLDTGYRVMRDGVPTGASTDGDELSFAVDHKGHRVWIESADSNGSRITSAAQADAMPGGCVIYDAESPALSADGNALAFIRESRGSGAVWITNPGDCDASGKNTEAVRVTPQDIDVRAISASPDGDFLISAVTAQSAGVFIVSRKGVTKPLLQSPTPFDSSEISADGSKLVITQLIANRWQLVVLDLVSHSRRQITFGDCNSNAAEWKNSRTIVYGTDCERGNGLTTLAELRIEQ